MANVASEQIGMGLRQSVVDHPSSGGRGEARGDGAFLMVPPVDARGADPTKRDWSAALELVREASEAIRIRDERATEMEIEHRLDAERASEDIRTLQEQLDETELRLAEAEARARIAEARAAESEVWLAKMHDAIVGSFSRVVANEDGIEAELRGAFGTSDDDAERSPA